MEKHSISRNSYPPKHLCCENIDAARATGNFQYSRKLELLNFLWSWYIYCTLHQSNVNLALYAHMRYIVCSINVKQVAWCRRCGFKTLDNKNASKVKMKMRSSFFHRFDFGVIEHHSSTQVSATKWRESEVQHEGQIFLCPSFHTQTSSNIRQEAGGAARACKRKRTCTCDKLLSTSLTLRKFSNWDCWKTERRSKALSLKDSKPVISWCVTVKTCKNHCSSEVILNTYRFLFC